MVVRVLQLAALAVAATATGGVSTVDTSKYMSQDHSTALDIMLQQSHFDLMAANSSCVDSGIASDCCDALSKWATDLTKIGDLATKDPLFTDFYRAIDMLDANPKLPPGFITETVLYFFGPGAQTVYNLGNYDMCIETSEKVASYFNVKIAVLNTKKVDSGEPSAMINFHYGLCLPAVCTTCDVKMLGNYIKPAINKIIYGIIEKHNPPVNTTVPDYIDDFLEEANINVLVTEATEAARWLELDGYGWAAVIILALLSVVALVTSIIDWYLDTNVVVAPQDNALLSIQADQDDEIEDLKKTLITKPKPTMQRRVLQAFSWYTNFGKLVSIKHSANAIPVLDGVRVLSMCYVIIGHTYFWVLLNPIGELKTVSNTLNDFSFMVFRNATMSVDSFFLLSGFLVAFGTFKVLDIRKGKFPWLAYYVYRFVRLTPAYLVVLILYMGLEPVLGNGPLWQDHVTATTTSCHQYWWTNILYVNNFYPDGSGEASGCMGWSWYLANDMQFHIISAFLLIPLWRKRWLGWAIIVTLIAASMIATSAINHYYNYTSGSIGAAPVDNDGQAYAHIYIKPYARIPAYLVGILFADIWRHSPKKEQLMSWKVGYPIIAVSAFIVYACLWAPYYFEGIIASDIYVSVSRVAWSGAVGAIIFVCMRGAGGPVNYLLSMPIYQPLGRLTFCAYLVHPIICDLVYSSMREPYRITGQFKIIYTYFGILCVSYIVALYLTLIVETPLINITKMFFK